jgi:hypothetical protein
MYLKSNKNIFNYYIIYRFRIKVFKLKKNLILAIILKRHILIMDII